MSIVHFKQTMNRRRQFVLAFLIFLPQLWLFVSLNLESRPISPNDDSLIVHKKEYILRHGNVGLVAAGNGHKSGRNLSGGIPDVFNVHDLSRRLKDAPFSPSIKRQRSLDQNYAGNSPYIMRQPAEKLHQNSSYFPEADGVNNAQLAYNQTRMQRLFLKRMEEDFRERLRKLKSKLFRDELGAGSDSVCAIPTEMSIPVDICPLKTVKWLCDMVPTYSVLNTKTRTIVVNCSGHWKVNQVDRTEHEQTVSRPGNYRSIPKWQYYEGNQEIAMETQYADIVCKGKRKKNLHNYHTQFLKQPDIDEKQQALLQETKTKEPNWRPISVLTIVMDSLSRAHAHRRCGIPKTIRLLEELYDGTLSDANGSPIRSHQSFLFNRFNSISGATVLNLTPMFSGELYKDVDPERIRQGIYAKDINEWVWQYANRRGYLTSYGVDNNSGLMGTRTNCKDCHYRPAVLAHSEHGWVSRENEQVISNVLSGLCDGNHMIHEHILNYTREFLRHPHEATWAALDLNAGHRMEMESINQVDEDLSRFLKTVLQENPNLAVFLLGDHGKPYHKQPGHLGGYYETLLPFLSVIMPTSVLRQSPSIMDNLIANQQRYLVPADLHLSMKSLLHFPHLDNVEGAAADKAINIFTIPVNRTCQDAPIPEWSCVCGIMRKLHPREWTDQHIELAQLALDNINDKHSKVRLGSFLIDGVDIHPPTSCLDLHLLKILHVFINENPGEAASSPRRTVFHVTFQTIELNTVWQAIIDSGRDIKQIKQMSLYQRFDVCWDRRVPLPFCVCDTSIATKDVNRTHL